MIEVNREPSRRDVRIFGLLWPLFFGGLGVLVLWKPDGLVGGAVFLGSAWLVSLAFNGENRRLQLAGVFLPTLLGLGGGGVLLGAPAIRVAIALWGVGLLGALLIWTLPVLGRRLYVGWMLAAVPIGWTISRLVLATVYYGVLTPVGWGLRLFGRDPMQRRIDRSCSSYWIERKTRTDADRYFRQF